MVDKQIQKNKPKWLLKTSLVYALTMGSMLWQYGLWSFQTRDAKLERFLPMNQHAQRKFIEF